MMWMETCRNSPSGLKKRPKRPFRQQLRHLERSNKPSSLMMMMLRDLREGKPVKAQLS